MQRYQEFFTVQFARAVVCEFVGTLLLLFIALGACFKWPSAPPSILQIALAFGLTIAVLVQVFGNVSGAHINPAVSIAFFVANQISIIRLVFYVVLQLLGAIAGAGLIYMVTPRNVRNTLALNELAPDVSPGEGLIVEIILTFTVMMCIFSATDKRQANNAIYAALIIGVAFTMAHLNALYYTGCSLNPARSFGPAVVMGNFSSAHWVFWLGPIIGACIASVVYNYLLFPYYLTTEERLAILQGFTVTEPECRVVSEINLDRNWT